MIFEFELDPAHLDAYEATAAELRAGLDRLQGFNGVERFESCSRPGRYVAIGFFQDEAAVRTWRADPRHRRAQTLGNTLFFSDYRLRMAEVVRDYTASDRSQAPVDSRAFHG